MLSVGGVVLILVISAITSTEVVQLEPKAEEITLATAPGL